MQDAMADAIDLEVEQRLPEWLQQRKPDGRVEAANLQSRTRRLQAAVLRAQSTHLLTADGIQSLVLPMLATVHLVTEKGGLLALAGGDPVWESHFAGRLDALLRVVDAAKQHNFSDFFGGLANEPDAEPEASQGSEDSQTTTNGSPASSGRPSVRVSPPATPRSATSGR